MNKKEECYEILGLKPPCTEQEIRAAFREKVKIAHPDNQTNNGDASQDNELVSRLIEAREWLLEHKDDSSSNRLSSTDYGYDRNRHYEKYEKEWEKARKKRQRKKIQGEITKCFHQIKAWDLRGIRLYDEDVLVGQIEDCRTEYDSKKKISNVRVKVRYISEAARWKSFYYMILKYTLEGLDDEKMEIIEELRKLHQDMVEIR